MTGLESILIFLVVMGVISIPLAAIVTRRSSPVGQAIADRIRGRRHRHPQIQQASEAIQAPEAEDARLRLIESQQNEIADLSAKIDFLQRLVEEKQEKQD